MDKVDKIKWQIHAETSVTQIMLWFIIAKLFGGLAWWVAGVFIIGNFITLIASTGKLGKDYYREDKK